MPAWSSVLWLIPVGMGAGFVQRVSGFGLGIFAMLFLPHMMPTPVAAAISCLFSCGTSTYNAVKFRRQIRFRTVLPMLLSALAVIPAAVYFSARLPGAVFERILGVVLIGLSGYFLLFQQRVRIRPTVTNGILAGGIGGALNGLFSTGGPPVVLYLTQASGSNLEYFAGIQFYFAITNWYATGMRALNGMLTPELLVLALVGFAGCMAGDRLGGLVFDRLDSRRLKQVIYIGMILSGLLMLLG